MSSPSRRRVLIAAAILVLLLVGGGIVAGHVAGGGAAAPAATLTPRPARPIPTYAPDAFTLARVYSSDQPVNTAYYGLRLNPVRDGRITGFLTIDIMNYDRTHLTAPLTGTLRGTHIALSTTDRDVRQRVIFDGLAGRIGLYGRLTSRDAIGGMIDGFTFCPVADRTKATCGNTGTATATP